jgi:acyl-CoA synthetase (AMP-forming)/AMP-acid ligase II
LTTSAVTLPGLLQRLVDSDASVHFPELDTVTPHAGLPAAAEATAQALLAAGVREGDIVAVMMPTVPAFLPALFGVSLAGAAVTVPALPPVPVASAKTLEKLAGHLDLAGVRHVVTEPGALPLVERLLKTRPDVTAHVLPADGTPPPTRRRVPLPADDGGRTALVQFTSGSTAAPKGVRLTHQALTSGVDAINVRIRAHTGDSLVQWVPLFHDMGLIALLCSLHARCDAHLFSPYGFLRRPERFLRHLHDVRGTITTGPDFSYGRLAAAASSAFGPGRRDPTALSSWRLALNGAETIRTTTLDAFSEAFAPLGVSDTAMTPCYGMAEATLAITLASLGEPPRSVTVDRGSLTPGAEVRLLPPGAEGARLVSVGVPVPGMEMELRDRQGGPAAEGHVGEIHIRGAAVTSGYLGGPTRTAHEWLPTGDHGFVIDGELFVAGRAKDMITVRGRNFFAEDVESVARRVPGIHGGHCVAVSDPLEERITVLAECARGAENEERQRLVKDIRSAVSDHLGLGDVAVELVAPHALPRTSSGKWQRTAIRQHVEELRQRPLALSPAREEGR